MPLKRHISKSSKREIYIDLVTIITTIITWKRRRKFRKRNETGFSLFHPFLELTLIRAMWYFFPPFHRGSCGLRIDLVDPSALECTSLFRRFEWRYEERNPMETTRRYHYGHPSSRRWSWRGIRSEHLSSSRCIHPFIGFVNFATGYVITETP